MCGDMKMQIEGMLPGEAAALSVRKRGSRFAGRRKIVRQPCGQQQQQRQEETTTRGRAARDVKAEAHRSTYNSLRCGMIRWLVLLVAIGRLRCMFNRSGRGIKQ